MESIGIVPKSAGNNTPWIYAWHMFQRPETPETLAAQLEFWQQECQFQVEKVYLGEDVDKLVEAARLALKALLVLKPDCSEVTWLREALKEE